MIVLNIKNVSVCILVSVLLSACGGSGGGSSSGGGGGSGGGSSGGGGGSGGSGGSSGGVSLGVNQFQDVCAQYGDISGNIGTVTPFCHGQGATSAPRNVANTSIEGSGAWEYTNSTASDASVNFSVSGATGGRMAVVYTNMNSSSAAGTASNYTGACHGVNADLCNGLSNISYNSLGQPVKAQYMPSLVDKSRSGDYNIPPSFVRGGFPFEKGIKKEANMVAGPKLSNVVDVTTKTWKTSGSLINSYDPKNTTLRYEGALTGGWTLNVWVEDGVYVANDASYSQYKITPTAVSQLADKFSNVIWRFIREVEGEPWGVHPYGNLIDQNNKEINIVVTNITPNNSPYGVMGFFWSANNFSVTDLPFSNEALAFFIDSETFGYSSDGVNWDAQQPAQQKMFSTLAHEATHMTSYYRKNVKYGLSSVETWMDEMIAMMAEEMIAGNLTYGNSYNPVVPLDSGTSSNSTRLNDFVYNPTCNITVWSSDTNSSHFCNVYDSYATAAALGVYLERVGGPQLLGRLINNNIYDKDTLMTHLNGVGYAYLPNTWAGLLHHSHVSAMALASVGDTVDAYHSYQKSVSGTTSGAPYYYDSLWIDNYWPKALIMTGANHTTYPRAGYAASYVIKGAINGDVVNQAITVPANHKATVMVFPN